MRTFFTCVFFLASALISDAQTVRQDVRLRVSHPDGLYEKGDTVRVWADVSAVPVDSLFLNVYRYCTWEPVTTTALSLKVGENLLFEKAFNESAQYVFEVTNGSDPREFKKGGDGNSFSGVVISPQDFRPGFEMPADFDRFWNREIRKMRRHRMKPSLTNLSEGGEYTTYHVEIDCSGPAPVRAYVAYPAGAQKGSLPIIINFHAAGNPGSASKASAAVKAARNIPGGALAMDINAHGMADDQLPHYYDSLAAGPLKDYAKREPDGKLADYHFKWMMLRAIRALDYMCRNPLWDGRRVIVMGTSQGGYQSAFLAGMDERVTAAVLTVPAGLDQGAPLQGRPASWPATMKLYPESTCRNIPYIDPAAFLRRTKAEIWCEIGLYDYTCPAANLFGTLNTVNSPKVIVTSQRPHSSYFTTDKEQAKKSREEFFRHLSEK